MKPKSTFPAFIVLVTVILFDCQTKYQFEQYPYQATKVAVGNSGMLVSPHPLSSQVGVEILRKGGNAIDAAIAVQFAMAVVYPRAGNLGGGGFMVIRLANGDHDALDYREKAPLAATRNMYLDSSGNVIPDLSRAGILAVGVPGTVAGMVAAHQKYGRLKFNELVKPAVQLAKIGFGVTQSEANRLNSFKEQFIQHNSTNIPFVKEKWSAGDLLIQPELANVLARIMAKGKAGFYQGPTANSIVKVMEAKNGLITYDDLSQYQPAWRKTVSGFYRDHQIISMPPASSGGVALLQMLKMVENYPLSKYGIHSVASMHLMAEAERRAFADRAEFLGDMDFYEVPLDSLLNENYLKLRMKNFNEENATVSKSVHAGDFSIGKESYETTHTSVIDSEGNAVSVTTTLNSNYGCKVMAAGFFLNNEMDDFSAKPGVPNQFGLLGAEANAIQPGKRMLSSMTPTIVLKKNKPFLILGTPGGSTIITSVFQVIVNVIDFGLDLPEAVETARFHHQWLPDRILVEREKFPPHILDSLRNKGHQIDEARTLGMVKAIQVFDDGSYQGVGDYRNPDDDARGF